LVAELPDVIPEQDRSKLQQLERILGELRRERGELSTKVADFGSQRNSMKVRLVCCFRLSRGHFRASWFDLPRIA
jgi:hypothetical protein